MTSSDDSNTSRCLWEEPHQHLTMAEQFSHSQCDLIQQEAAKQETSAAW